MVWTCLKHWDLTCHNKPKLWMLHRQSPCTRKASMTFPGVAFAALKRGIVFPQRLAIGFSIVPCWHRVAGRVPMIGRCKSQRPKMTWAKMLLEFHDKPTIMARYDEPTTIEDSYGDSVENWFINLYIILYIYIYITIYIPWYLKTIQIYITS